MQQKTNRSKPSLVTALSCALQVGLAQMLKGGVIMDVTNVEEARIAEEAGAVAVMALERVPADIRRDGGVARMRCATFGHCAVVDGDSASCA